MILTAEHRIPSGQFAWKERHALVAGRVAPQRAEFEGREVGGPKQFLAHRWARESGIGTDIGHDAVVVDESNEAKVLNSLPLTGGHGIDDDIRQIAAVVTVQPGTRVVRRAPGNDLDTWGNRFFARVIEDNAALLRPYPGSKRHRRDVPFANASLGQDEAERAGGHAGLVGMRYDTGVEQGGGLE